MLFSWAQLVTAGALSFVLLVIVTFLFFLKSPFNSSNNKPTQALLFYFCLLLVGFMALLAGRQCGEGDFARLELRVGPGDVLRAGKCFSHDELTNDEPTLMASDDDGLAVEYVYCRLSMVEDDVESRYWQTKFFILSPRQIDKLEPGRCYLVEEAEDDTILLKTPHGCVEHSGKPHDCLLWPSSQPVRYR